MTMSTPSSRQRGSQFSNSNLTTLESLVLEVDLENAKHSHKQRNNSLNSSAEHEPIKECEMDAEDYEYLQQLLGNDCCADCSSPHTEWASVSFGILLCATCSGVHRALGTHISRVRSIKMDSWSDEHLELMRLGGNYACRRFLEKNNIADDDVPFDFYETPIPERYSSSVAEAYKKQLKQRAMANTTTTTTTTMGHNKGSSKLDETESSTETGESKHSNRSSFSSNHSSKRSSFASSSSKHNNNKANKLSVMDHTQDEESEYSFAEEHSDSPMGAKKILPVFNNNNKEDSDDSDRAAIDEGDEEDEEDEGSLDDAQDSEAAQDSENEEEDNSSVGAPPKRTSLESWFKKAEGVRRVSDVPVPSSDFSLSGFTTNTIQTAITSLTSRGRRSIRRSSSSVSASAPTITYMGRSFSADGSDDSKLHVKRESARLRRHPDVSLLSDMADKQEKIARENLEDSWRECAWRESAPATLMQWTADKKIEPFSNLPDNSSASYPASSTRRGGRKPCRHESLRQKFAYTDADLLKITQDDQEFARLKAGLRSKGAITNEMLKQRLYAFVAKSKLRDSKTAESIKANAASVAGDEKRSKSKSRQRRRTVQASKSEDLTLLRSHTIHSL